MSQKSWSFDEESWSRGGKAAPDIKIHTTMFDSSYIVLLVVDTLILVMTKKINFGHVYHDELPETFGFF